MGLVQSSPREVHPATTSAAFPEAFCVKPQSVQDPVTCSPAAHVALTVVPGSAAMAVLNVTNPTPYLVALHIAASRDVYAIRPAYACLPPGRTLAIAITVAAADAHRVLTPPSKIDKLTIESASFKNVPTYLHSRLQTAFVAEVWGQIPPEYITTKTLTASCSPWTSSYDEL
ncbi:hypothetical protein ACHHYP_10840 [Achlya hypogyna]|uniref:MSP domain-containing protein n=1 Tax=Achlya hypogyna TaxID=1202772 RepID=A0A1V9YKD4_ACHHY|nr:hypothetical protein ACHHYP_10840 [Achlya hypogyna]